VCSDFRGVRARGVYPFSFASNSSLVMNSPPVMYRESNRWSWSKYSSTSIIWKQRVLPLRKTPLRTLRRQLTVQVYAHSDLFPAAGAADVFPVDVSLTAAAEEGGEFLHQAHCSILFYPRNYPPHDFWPDPFLLMLLTSITQSSWQPTR